MSAEPAAQPKTRAAILAEADRIARDIRQIFTDCASWNENVRKPHEAPIDPDPDGALACALAHCDGLLNGDVYLAPELKAGHED